MTTAVDPESAAFGSRLRQAREAARLTQTDAAKELAARGVKVKGKATVSAWEVGRSLPSALVLRAICRLYSCSADPLLWDSEAGTPGAASAITADLARRLAALDEARRAAVLRALEAVLDAADPAESRLGTETSDLIARRSARKPTHAR